MTRVAVFVDYQNVYKGCRRAFGWDEPSDPPWVGQIDPYRLGTLLCQLGRNVDPERKLVGVKVFRGQPSNEENPKGYSACQRQVESWRRNPLVEVTTRLLDYNLKVDDGRGRLITVPREKGIDVLLAMGVVGGMPDYDVAILCSRDTDLQPALEEVRRRGKIIEQMCWGRARGWTVNGRALWCHHLQPSHYDQVSDEIDYTKQP